MKAICELDNMSLKIRKLFLPIPHESLLDLGLCFPFFGHTRLREGSGKVGN